VILSKSPPPPRIRKFRIRIFEYSRYIGFRETCHPVSQDLSQGTDNVEWWIQKRHRVFEHVRFHDRHHTGAGTTHTVSYSLFLSSGADTRSSRRCSSATSSGCGTGHVLNISSFYTLFSYIFFVLKGHELSTGWGVRRV
jgi:hypothetical protein